MSESNEIEELKKIVEPAFDPGNSDPEVWTEDLTPEETLEANKAVEQSVESGIYNTTALGDEQA